MNLNSLPLSLIAMSMSGPNREALNTLMAQGYRFVSDLEGDTARHDLVSAFASQHGLKLESSQLMAIPVGEEGHTVKDAPLAMLIDVAARMFNSPHTGVAEPVKVECPVCHSIFGINLPAD